MKDLSQLGKRIVPKQEVQDKSKKSKRILTIQGLVEGLKDENGQWIEVGAALELDGFDSETEGKNWVKNYMPDLTKELREKHGWGIQKQKNGKNAPILTSEAHPKDEKISMWLIRIGE